MELRQVLVAILAEPGHTVLTASNGYEALGIPVERVVDLLITDVRMPGISGFEFARQATLMRPYLHVISRARTSTLICTPDPPMGASSASRCVPATCCARSKPS